VPDSLSLAARGSRIYPDNVPVLELKIESDERCRDNTAAYFGYNCNMHERRRKGHEKRGRTSIIALETNGIEKGQVLGMPFPGPCRKIVLKDGGIDRKSILCSDGQQTLKCG